MSFIGNRPDSYGYSTTAYEQFSGNSVQTNYTLSRSVSANSDIFVTVDNVPQVPGDAYYITDLTTLTFTGAPGLGTHNIVVVYRNYVQSGIAPGANTVTAPQIAANTIQAYHLSSGLLSPITDIFTANGSTSTFALSQNAVSSNSCTVTVNGITQAYPANYSVSQNVLTFTSAPANNSVIRCVQHAIVGTSVVPIDGSVTTSKLAPNLTLTGNTITSNLTVTGTFSGNVANTSITGLIKSNQIANISNTQIIGTTLPGAGQVNNIMMDSGSSTGNGAALLPKGNTAQRPANAVIGMIRFNTDSSVYENYTSQGWLKISVPIPIISSISGTIYAGNTSTITINGSNFQSITGTVTFQISGSSPVTVSATPNAGGTQVSCAVPSAIYSVASGGTVINVSYTNTDNGVSGPYSMTAVGLPTGGTLVQTGNTRVHTFTSSSSLVVPTGFTANANYLVVAGGGSGGSSSVNSSCGGGGAGGLLSGYTNITAQSYTITVGSGGSGALNTQGSSGQNSSFSTFTAIGGGAGGGGTSSTSTSPGAPGGSGGGSLQPSLPGSGTSGQGNSGGTGNVNGPCWGGGGGGGAGSSGSSGTSTLGGAGGAGLQWTNGSYYAGGGGGASYNGYAGGSGGIGGGGAGGSTSSGVAGSPNTGGGGGASSYPGNTYGAGANGGSGIVIISYQIP